MFSRDVAQIWTYEIVQVHGVWVDVYDEVRLIYIFLQHLHYLKELLSKKKLQSVSAGAEFPTGIQFWVFT